MITGLLAEAVAARSDSAGKKRDSRLSGVVCQALVLANGICIGASGLRLRDELFDVVAISVFFDRGPRANTFPG
jgi:hypothetical protein